MNRVCDCVNVTVSWDETSNNSGVGNSSSLLSQLDPMH